jgi:molecular chaperone DnaJ
MFFGGGHRRQGGPRHGSDIRIQVNVDLQDIVAGKELEVEIPRHEACAKCGGTGAAPGTTRRQCTACGGNGQVQQAQTFGSRRLVTITTCPQCRGKGTVVDSPCPDCKGQGRTRVTRRLLIRIPPGAQTGTSLRYGGQGEGGELGGPPGDLYAIVVVRPHPRFERENSDLLTEVPISYPQAALGDRIEVQTLTGKAELTVPPGTQTGKVFRLRGLGLPHLGGAGRGDQYVRVVIEVPRHLSSHHKALLKELWDLERGGGSGTDEEGGKGGGKGRIFGRK